MKNFINIHVTDPIIETCNFDEILDFVKSNRNIYNKIFVSAGVATALVINDAYINLSKSVIFFISPA